jgi:Spy/CpxP family protein refolding chaperone
MQNIHSRRSIMTAAAALGTLAATSATAAPKKGHEGHGTMDHSHMNHGAPEMNFKLTRNEERVVRAIRSYLAAEVTSEIRAGISADVAARKVRVLMAPF